jgi:hypothetical protein
MVLCIPKNLSNQPFLLHVATCHFPVLRHCIANWDALKPASHVTVATVPYVVTVDEIDERDTVPLSIWYKLPQSEAIHIQIIFFKRLKNG